VRKAMIEAQVFLTYRRDLNNLSIQEARLRRQHEKDQTELKRLIAERRAAAEQKQHAETKRWRNAGAHRPLVGRCARPNIDHYKTALEMRLAFDPPEIGFEFSTEEIIARDRQSQIDAAIRSGRYYELKKKGWLKLEQPSTC